MNETDTRRMILRRLDPHAEAAASVSTRIAATPGVDVLDRPSASSMLVDGTPAAIDTLVKGLSGWTAFPISTFEHPETRPRVLKAPD